MEPNKNSESSLEIMSAVSLMLGLLTLVTGMTYLVYRFLSDRAYRAKWQDYEDCGMM
ncbi:MAG: hypothetical protein HFE45_04770 [Oscillospiraceae bacterium]|jgi:flagellar biogenesis protein FliO|nr:hypothetical protein [Oscillospiraceae bacterium]